MIMVMSYIRYQMTVVLMENGYSNSYSNIFKWNRHESSHDKLTIESLSP